MAGIHDWQYFFPLDKNRFLFIGDEPDHFMPFFSEARFKPAVLLTAKKTGVMESQHEARRIVADIANLPFKNRQFDGILCGVPDLSEQDILALLVKTHDLLDVAGVGFYFLKNRSIIRRMKSSAVNSLLRNCFSEIRSYFSLPSFENPWYILPGDDAPAIRFYIENLLSSRFKSRRMAVHILRMLIKLGGENIVLNFLPWQVIVGKKAN